MSLVDARQTLLRAAYGALAVSEIDVSRAWVRVGWLMAGDEAEEIRAQWRQSAGFEWVAVGYSPVSFFDLHAGLVVREGRVDVGLHAHRRSPVAALLAQSEAGVLRHTFADAVAEEQYSMPSSDEDIADHEVLAEKFASCLTMLRDVATRAVG